MEIFFSNWYSFFNFNIKFELSSHYNKQEEQYKKLQFITNWREKYYIMKVEISCQVFLQSLKASSVRMICSTFLAV